MAASSGAASPKRVELAINRLFDAPRELVFEVWSKAEHLVHWFGPKDFTLPVCEVDFRPGGKFRQCMRGPDGTDYWQGGEYVEIVPPERIVFTAVLDDDPGHEIRTTIVFIERGGKTEVDVRQSMVESEASRGAPEGWAQSLDRLGEYLATLSGEGR